LPIASCPTDCGIADLENRVKVQVADQLQGRADTPGFTAGPIKMGSRWPRVAYRLSEEKHDKM